MELGERGGDEGMLWRVWCGLESYMWGCGPEGGRLGEKMGWGGRYCVRGRGCCGVVNGT